MDLTLSAEEYICSNIYADGTISSVTAEILYTSSETGQLANGFGMVLKYTTATTGDCIQIGGFNERCSHLYSWPTSWSDAVSGNTYTATIDVSDAAYAWPEGDYTVN